MICKQFYKPSCSYQISCFTFLILLILNCQLTKTSSERDNADAANIDNQRTKYFSSKFTNLALKMLRNLHNNSKSENLIISPLSLFTAIGLCHLGASESTRKEVVNFMEISETENELFNQSLHENINLATKAVKNVNKATIHSVNGMFIEKLIPLKKSFLTDIRKYYNIDLVHVDFENGGDAATKYINKWISEETKNQIPELFKKTISTSTKTIIASSVYFSSNWFYPFKDSMTYETTFDTGHRNITISSMQNRKEVRYIDSESFSFEAIALPYEGDEFFIYFLLPYGNQTVNNLTDHLTAHDIQTMIESMNNTFVFVDYKIPKMKLKGSIPLSKYRKKIGLGKIFENANFQNMLNFPNINISEIIHATEMQIDEKGTVASGLTSSEHEIYSEYIPLAEPFEFFVNKPFLFLITHVKTSIPIYFGLVYNPLDK